MNNENIFSQENKKINMLKRFDPVINSIGEFNIKGTNGKSILSRDSVENQKKLFESMRVLQNRDIVSIKIAENPNDQFLSAIFKYNGKSMSVKLDKYAFGKTKDINDKYMLNNIKHFVNTSISEISKVNSPSFEKFEAIIKNNYDIGLMINNSYYNKNNNVGMEEIKKAKLSDEVFSEKEVEYYRNTENVEILHLKNVFHINSSVEEYFKFSRLKSMPSKSSSLDTFQKYSTMDQHNREHFYIIRNKSGGYEALEVSSNFNRKSAAVLLHQYDKQYNNTNNNSYKTKNSR